MKQRFPQLKTFSTISPVPGLRKWLSSIAEEAAQLARDFGVDSAEESCEKLERFAARYFLEQKDARGKPLDPVARFHLKNGARLEHINVLGNPSDAGMKASLGTMVNYVYDLSKVEQNHENYVLNNKIACSSQVKKMLKK